MRDGHMRAAASIRGPQPCLIERARFKNGRRIIYFNPGLAVGQSLFLVEESLRDDLGRLPWCCHVGSSGERPVGLLRRMHFACVL